MATFTFITDFRGGTYICQKNADDLRAACLLWKEDIVAGGYVEHLDAVKFSEAFEEDFEELPPVALDEVMNVWVFHLAFGKHMMDVHIVQTDTAVAEVGKEIKHRVKA
jgi:hypothetical protein